MSQHTDAKSRERFIHEIRQNFSIIAPAGTGKTQSIVDRLCTMARLDSEPSHCRIAIVTYTRKAALEMEVRLKECLHSLGSKRDLFLSQVFFGTIHSLCLKLLKEFGLELGLSKNLQLVEDEPALWTQFCEQSVVPLQDIPETLAQSIKSLIDIEILYLLGRRLGAYAAQSKKLSHPPHVNLRAIYEWIPEKPSLRRGTESSIALLKNWEVRVQSGEVAVPFPQITAGGPAFIEACEACLRPLKDWVCNAYAFLAQRISQDYQTFRCALGQVNYSDMVFLANKLWAHPVAARAIDQCNYHIILDEAQDTDEEQFSFLLRLAGIDLGKSKHASDTTNGRFVMVGDAQQSIYSMRTDLHNYCNIHRLLTHQQLAFPLIFSVTFRCDQAIVQWVNNCFPNVLEATRSQQVDFVPLEARLDAGRGQVLKLAIDKEGEDAVANEAHFLAQWLTQVTLEDLKARDWSEVAILCPRNDWLKALTQALDLVEHPYQLHARNLSWKDIPLFRWLLSLLYIIDKPYASFEIAGVLREIFGIADSIIAEWVNLRKDPAINKNTESHPLSLRGSFKDNANPVDQALNLLSKISMQATGLGIRQSIGLILKELQFMERIQAIPHPSGVPHEKILQDLLHETATKESQGWSLKELVQHWQRRLEESLEMASAQKGKLQLISCHSAKGLQWDCVILPFLFRPISFRNEPYPQCYPTSPGKLPWIKLDASHRNKALEAKKSEAQAAEQERLLYVAMTRPRHSLILLDDADLFQETQNSFADFLRIEKGKANRAYWDSLAPFLLKKQGPIQVSSKMPPSKKSLKNIESQKDTWEVLRVFTSSFPKRLLPSQLGPEENIEKIQSNHLDRISTPTSGLDYGNDWHRMMEKMPWSANIIQWKDYLYDSIRYFRNPDRAKHEIELFLGSELAQRLQQLSPWISTEVPFFWKKSSELAYEGTIDCLAWDPQLKVGWIIDWKTNLVCSMESIVEAYRPQIQTYLEALNSLDRGCFRASIYATALGSCWEAPLSL